MKRNNPGGCRWKDRLWLRIFRNVMLIFLAFLLVLTVANELLLMPFYTRRQKQLLLQQMEKVEEVRLTRSDVTNGRLSRATMDQLSAISDTYHFEIELYLENGEILYTSSGSKMMDHAGMGPQLSMQRDPFAVDKREEREDGTVFEMAHRRYGNHEEYLICRREIGYDVIAEIRIQKQLIVSAAKTANRLIFYIAAGCCLLSVVWVLIFARRFSRPISEMNRITGQLSRLDFSQKVTVRGSDEIGQLAGSVNEMSDSLSAALTELQTANARLRNEIELERQLDGMRRDFVANVSHELKTPISIISGYAEGLKLNVNEASREEYCNIILDESRRMNQLVLKILELSKYESGRMEIHPEPFGIASMAARLTERIFRDSGICAELKINESVRVSADPLLTEQVLQAYLENALAHTPKDGTVTVEAVEKDGFCRVSVFNTGSSVDPERMPQIWQSFYRGDASHKRESDRFGLGLSIVSAITRLHGTSCGVYNTADGVCFWFELPIAQ